MNKHFFKAALLSCTLLFAAVADVDAARLGGGRSIGRAPSAPMQRQATPPQKPVQQAQPTAPAAAPAQAPAPSRFGGMGGMLGGLAAGLGIAYLFSHFGLGEGMASMFSGLLIALLVGFAIMFVIRRLLPSFSGAQGMQRTSEPLAKQEPAFQPATNSFGGAAPVPEAFQSTIPPVLMNTLFWRTLNNSLSAFKKLGIRVIWFHSRSTPLLRCSLPSSKI